MAEPVNVDDTSFKDVVLDSDVPVLVDFWAPWCAPCRAVAPVVEELAGEYEGRIRFGKVNVDDNPKVATEYGIRSIPTLLLFRDGKPMKQVVGFTGKGDLKKHLDSAIS